MHGILCIYYSPVECDTPEICWMSGHTCKFVHEHKRFWEVNIFGNNSNDGIEYLKTRKFPNDLWLHQEIYYEIDYMFYPYNARRLNFSLTLKFYFWHMKHGLKKYQAFFSKKKKSFFQK